MGTSLPETAVSVSASLTGNNELAVSNVVGSNIFNLMVVIGVCGVLATVNVAKETIRRDIPFSLICAGMLLLFGTAGIGDTSSMILGHLDRRLEELTKSHMRINKEIQMQKEQNQIRNIEKLVEYGNHPVVISILQTDGSRRSMAENGFEPLGIVKRNKRGCYLELTIREMHAVSRINGKQMKGHLTCLKYLQGDRRQQARLGNCDTRALRFRPYLFRTFEIQFLNL